MPLRYGHGEGHGRAAVRAGTGDGNSRKCGGATRECEIRGGELAEDKRRRREQEFVGKGRQNV